MNRRWLIGTLSSLLVMAMVVIYMTSERFEAYYWNWTQTWELADEEKEAIQTCSAVTWLTMARIQEQNIEDSCSLEWLAEQAVLVDDALKLSSLHDSTMDSTRSIPIRFRAHFLLLIKKERSPGFPIVLEQLSETRRKAFVDWMVRSEYALNWLAPLMRQHIGVQRLAAELEATATVLKPALTLEGLRHPMMVDVSYRELLVELALEDTGYLREEIHPGTELRKTDGPSFPFRVPDNCKTLTAPDCLVWFAYQLESRDGTEWSDHFEGREKPLKSTHFKTLESLFTQGPELENSFLHAVRTLWTEYENWFEALLPSERWGVFFYWFFERTPPFGPTGLKSLDEMHPMSRTILGASSPWLGLAALVDVIPDLRVYQHKQQPQLAIMVGPDGITHQIGACGVSQMDVAPDKDALTEMTKTQIGAHALIELSSYAWTQGDIKRADHYLALAHRWDAPLVAGILSGLKFRPEESVKGRIPSEFTELFTQAAPIPSLLYAEQVEKPCSTRSFGGP